MNEMIFPIPNSKIQENVKQKIESSDRRRERRNSLSTVNIDGKEEDSGIFDSVNGTKRIKASNVIKSNYMPKQKYIFPHSCNTTLINSRYFGYEMDTYKITTDRGEEMLVDLSKWVAMYKNTLKKKDSTSPSFKNTRDLLNICGIPTGHHYQDKYYWSLNRRAYKVNSFKTQANAILVDYYILGQVFGVMWLFYDVQDKYTLEDAMNETEKEEEKEVVKNGFINIPYKKKFGPAFKLLDINDPKYKEKIKIRFKRVREIFGPLYSYLLGIENIKIPSLGISLQEEETKLKAKIDGNGNVFFVDDEVPKEMKFLDDLCEKYQLGLTNKSYRFLVESKGWTSLSEIYKKLTKFLQENKSMFLILKCFETDSEGTKHRRQSGLFTPPSISLPKFISNNPATFIDAVKQTKELGEFLKKSVYQNKEQQEIRETKCLFKEKRKYNSNKISEVLWEIDCTLGLGIKHDGAQNFNSKRKRSGRRDRNNFEFGCLTLFDGNDSFSLNLFFYFYAFKI